MYRNRKQVVYLINSPLMKRDFDRFGIQAWIDKGWKVRVFDITKILYPKLLSLNTLKNIVCFDGLIIFKKKNSLFSELNNLERNLVFIDLLGVSFLENKIRKIAKVHGVIVGQKLGSIPTPQTSSIWQRASLFKRPIIFLNILKENLKYNFKKILLKKIAPDYMIVGGTKSMVDIEQNKTSIIEAHNFDYDFFLKQKNIKQKKFSNFLVFLDEDGPYHSDFVKLGIKPYVTKKKYYPAVDKGLNIIAKSLNLNIKIAAHPRSDYENKKIKYQHLILENKTFELIKDADVVIGHSSTALQLAVIMNKPIIIVTTNEIQNAYYARPYLKLINCFASELGKKIINLDNCHTIQNFNAYLSIEKEKYKKYFETYVKTKRSPDKLLWYIVIEKIEKELQF